MYLIHVSSTMEMFIFLRLSNCPLGVFFNLARRTTVSQVNQGTITIGFGCTLKAYLVLMLDIFHALPIWTLGLIFPIPFRVIVKQLFKRLMLDFKINPIFFVLYLKYVNILIDWISQQIPTLAPQPAFSLMHVKCAFTTLLSKLFI